MKITHSLISATSALALFAGSVSPALAYRRAEPPVPTTVLRQREEIRNLYADAYSSILELSSSFRGVAASDTTGRSMLARSQVRAAQRNYRRHVLGYLRGVDYRVLNVAGDTRRQNGAVATKSSLPFSLIQTGGNSDNNGSWMWDRPTRRDIRSNAHYGCVNDRDIDILGSGC
ncbi:MAG: hypothetical protein O3A81_01615 [bacterium]|nr:hypothetical protein [bacterium]